MIAIFFTSCIPVPGFAQTGQIAEQSTASEPNSASEQILEQSITGETEDTLPENQKENVRQTGTDQKLPQEDLENPAGIPSDRTGFFLDEEEENDLTLSEKSQSVVNFVYGNPIIHQILEEKGRLDLLDRFKLSGFTFIDKKASVEEQVYQKDTQTTVEEQVYGKTRTEEKNLSEESESLSVKDQVYDIETEQLLMNVLAEADQMEAWYNTLVGPSTINGVKENKYAAWNNTGEIVSPENGDLTVKINDITLPGRNGLDLSLGRIYQSSQALMGDWRVSSFDKYHSDFSAYYQNRYNLGAGWSFAFPSVQVEEDIVYPFTNVTELYYHTGQGDIYHVNFTSDPNDSNLEDYYKKDGVFKEDSGFSYWDGGGDQQELIVSKYAFETADKTKQYFAKDGRLMAIIDRFGNQITFKHDLFPVTNRVVNYDFDDEKLDESSISWYWKPNESYFVDYIGHGVDDETALTFDSPNSRVSASALSKPIQVLPSTKYYISGYLLDALSSGTAYVRIRQFFVARALGSHPFAPNYYMEEIPDSTIEIAESDYEDQEWREFAQYIITDNDAEYIQIEFYNHRAENFSCLDKVRFDRVWPLITEITDSIGRKINFSYVDNFYVEEDSALYDHNPITVTIQDPARQNSKVFTYDREVEKTSYTYQYEGYIEYIDSYCINADTYVGRRRYPSLTGFHDGETQYQYKHGGGTNWFSFEAKNTNGNYGKTRQLLLERMTSRNSRVEYDFGECEARHLGEDGFYEKFRVTSREEEYYANGSWDGGGYSRQEYSYGGYYNGNYYYNESGYSRDYYSSHTLPENPNFQWICTMEQENGLKTETHFKGSSIGLREEKTVTYHSNGEKETTYYEAYDSTFPDQVTRVKTDRQNANGIYSLYTGYTYHDWGGLASETRPLTPDQWNNAGVKSQNTISYTYDPVYKLPAAKTYYQNPSTPLMESTTYNSNGAVLTTTNAKGETTTYEYGDAAHKGNCTRMITSLEDGKQAITEIDYSGAYFAYPTTITRKYTEDGTAKNSTSTRGYEFLRGNVVRETDALGNSTLYQYDGQGRIQTVTYPVTTGKEGPYTLKDNYEYANYTLVPAEYGGRAAFGVHQYTTKTLSGQSPVTITRSYGYYDDYGNLLVSEYWDNDRGIWVRTKYQFDDYGQLTWIKDAQDRQTSCLIDEWGRVKTVTDPQGNRYQYDYDTYHNTKTTSFIPQGGGAENQYIETYDQRGRIISRKGYPDGMGGAAVEETYEYDLLDNLTKLTDAGNKITWFQYDALGSLTKVTNALGEQADYEYNKLGNLIRTKQYQGTQTFENSKAYDERGALISARRPSGPAITYKNNALGLPVQVTDAAGKVTGISYEGNNRAFETVASHDGISRYYHPLGGVEKYTVWNDAGGSRIYGEGLEYSFYATGLTRQRKNGNYPVDFQYDVLGNLTRITDPFSLAVHYSYDSLDRLDTVIVEGKVFDYEFYPDGMVKAINYPATPGGQAIRSEYTYDNINRLKTVINKVGSNIISQYSYGYDPNGNITSVTENGAITQYTYDDLNRLTGINRAGGEEISYEYDSRGNRTELVVSQAIIDNLTSGTFSYNSWDELAQFTGAATYQYQYDPEGLRTKKESSGGTIRYHLDNSGRVIAESNAAGQVTAQNIWGYKALARKVNGAYYYYIYNGHGDVVQVLDINGNIVNSYTYDEWGNVRNKAEQIANPIRYAGEYYDEESGLYYLRARYYDPSIGRFISEDSNEGQLNNPLSLNLYTYCENDPVKYVDPDGKAKIVAVPQKHSYWAWKVLQLLGYTDEKSYEEYSDNFDKMYPFAESINNNVVIIDNTPVGALKFLSKASPQILGRNLVASGIKRPNYSHATHHIVAGTSRKANEARAILQKYGIDINDAPNGVFLPTAKDVSNSAYHPSLHTNAYYEKVTNLLENASSRQDVLDILKDIGEQLSNGTFMK